MNHLIDFLVALQFLTTAPPILKRIFTPAEMGRAVGYYPLVGLLLGAILWVAAILLARIFPPLVVAALLLTLWTILSGALHVDGFLDSIDGLLGGYTPEKRLEILRDKHKGAFAIAAGILLFLIKFTALISLTGKPALLLAPTLGRWAMAVAIVAFPYARPQGLGRDMKDNATWKQVLLASLIALLAAWFSAGCMGLIALGIALLTLLATARFILVRIPGLTGDSYGMINEMVELFVLLAFTVVL